MSAEYAEGSVGGEQACRHWGFADGDEEAARVRGAAPMDDLRGA